LVDVTHTPKSSLPLQRLLSLGCIRVVDREALSAVISRHLEHSSQRQLQTTVGALFDFRVSFPTDHYRLNLELKHDAELYVKLVCCDNDERSRRKDLGLKDTSQVLAGRAVKGTAARVGTGSRFRRAGWCRHLLLFSPPLAGFVRSERASERARAWDCGGRLRCLRS
jgi:hypothetical protein